MNRSNSNPSNNTASLDTPIRGVSDLEIVATAQPGTVEVGQPMTYTIAVNNVGPADEPDAVVSGSLPPGMTVRSALPTQGSAPTFNQGAFTLDLGPLHADSSQPATITLVAIPGITSVGLQSATFVVQGQDYDPDTSNNTAQVASDIEPVTELGVSITPGHGPAIAQSNWTYTLTVSNAGPSDATGVIATSALPAGVEFVSASSSEGSSPIEQDGTITASLGDLVAGKTATVTIVVQPTPAVAADGSMVLSAAVQGDETDPNPSNTQTTLTVPVMPSVTLAVRLVSTQPWVQSGQTITFLATVNNLGTTPATNVVVNLPSVNGLTYESLTASQGSMILVNGQLVGRFGALDPGASATLTVVELATAPGDLTQPASLSDPEYNLDPQGASTSATVQVQESAGTVQFAGGNDLVSDLSGVAVLSVVRLYGASGSITVNYQTIAVDATPGVNYLPTSGTLTLGPGQTSASIQVPVLNDPYENHDNYVNVVLEGPTGGAVLGGMTTTVLRIVDSDPDVTPPQVSGLSWAGSSGAISSLTLNFSSPLDPNYASDPSNYQIVNLALGSAVPIASVSYNATTDTVTVVPAAPLPSGQYDRIEVVGSGAAAVRDLAGNLLDGSGFGIAGSNYVATFAQGTRLQYVDNRGNRVTLQLKGAGYLEQVRDASGEGILLDVVGMVPHRTTLSGNIKAPGRHKKGQTDLGTITGLGQFGDVHVLLKTPPFRVTQFPFVRRGSGVL